MLLHKTLNESIHNLIINVRFTMLKPQQITRPGSSRKTHKASALLTASLTLIASAVISAQETDQSDSSTDGIEEIIVTGPERLSNARSTSNATLHK